MPVLPLCNYRVFEVMALNQLLDREMNLLTVDRNVNLLTMDMGLSEVNPFTNEMLFK